MNKGIYFLANDRTFDLAVAFLNSFRRFNPAIPLCLIPFDNHTARVQALAGQYKFSVFRDRESLERCDAWSRSFHDQAKGQYRKLVMWEGPFDEFIYVDVDTVILRSLEFAFSYLTEYDVVTGHSDIIGSRKFVWKEGSGLRDRLTEREENYAASTGFIASRRGIISREHVARLLPGAVELKDRMELMCMEQPLLNYLIVRSTSRYTSLHVLGKERPSDRVPHECWAGDPNWRIQLDGQCFYDGRKAEVMFVHWAGQWAAPVLPNIFLRGLSSLGLWRAASAVRKDMKMGDIWRHFRHTKPEDSQRFAAEPVAATKPAVAT